jgi:hypothetical protein
MTYKPPVPARIFTRSTKEERERLDNYDQGYRHGKKERERRKK